MSDYIPTTEQVRVDFATRMAPASDRIRYAGFDRWFKRIRAEAKAEALREAAGYSDFHKHLGCAMQELRLGNEELEKEREAAAAESKAQAELEAEALELLNAQGEAMGFRTPASWDELADNTKDWWLAVARKAREMRAET